MPDSDKVPQEARRRYIVKSTNKRYLAISFLYIKPAEPLGDNLLN